MQNISSPPWLMITAIVIAVYFAALITRAVYLARERWTEQGAGDD